MRKIFLYLIILITFTLVNTIQISTKVIPTVKSIPISNKNNLSSKTISNATILNNLPTKTISNATKSIISNKTFSIIDRESEDCKKLNDFLKNVSGIDNCKKCYFDEYGNINKLNFKKNCINEEYCIEINKNSLINFENFPDFQKLIE
eukprot:jgi/Orpsp1_1/1188297/evm.model.d7180000063716.1